MEVAEQIKVFQEFIDANYLAELLEKVRKGENFLIIDFSELVKFNPELADNLIEQPEEVIKAAEISINNFDLPSKINDFKIRLTNIPENLKIMIRNIRSKHLNKLLMLEGTVRQKSDVRPQATSAKFECPSCGNIINVLQLDNKFKEPSRCGCGRKGRFRLLSKELVDIQGIVLEEATKDLEGGEQPKRMNILLKNDLVSPITEKKTNPGSTIRIIGMLKEVPIILRSGGQSTKFDLLIESNNVEAMEEDYTNIKISPEEEEEIKAISQDPKVFQKLAVSLAPGIFGHDKVKEAMILQFVGGTKKLRDDGVTTRGDIHMLLIGDPGSGKSSLLKRASVVAPKSRFVSGKGVSGAGLCIAPDELVQTNPGGMHKIVDVVENKLREGKKKYCKGVWNTNGDKNNKKILTLDKNLRIKPKKIDKFWKLKAPKRMKKIVTRSGKSITITPNTKIFTMENGKIKWKKSSEIKEGEYIATARNTHVKESKNILTISLVKSNPIVYGVKKVVKEMVIKAVEQYKNKREFCKTHRFSENAIYTNWVNENARGNIHLKDLKKLAKLSGTPLEKISKRIKGVSLYKGHKIRLPIYVNKKLMYFAGLIAGDGDLSGDKNRISIRFSNNSDLLIKKFIKLSNDLFGTKCNCSSKGNENRPPSFRFGSNIVFEILSSLGVPKSPKSNKIDLTNNILDLPNDVVAYYIKALFDCDGSVIKRNTKGSSYIDLTTTSQILAKKMQLLLLRYGIIAKIRQRMPIKGKINSKYKKYILEIRGKDNLISFKDKIGFESYEKKKKLDTIINRLTSSNTNVDIIPGINKIIKKLRKSYTISPRVVLKSGTSSLENEYYNMSRPQLKKILNNMQKAKSDIKDNENYQTLQKLQKSDIFWDEIKDIQNITNHKYKHVYDLTVNNSHNFLVNGILVHNTAAVVKDEFLAGWSLEAGAMVLANKGILMIDEMDKMTPEDRSAMHEGLEQQSVSISKANIQATLRCETTVLAAANPKFGRFDPYETIAKQIDLPPALINRFDLIFTIKDIPDEVKDERLAKFILTLHKEKMAEKAPVDTDLLRKYLSYAKQNIFPTLTDTALEELKDYYVKMRTSGSSEEKGMRAIPISPRQLEALIRLSEAAAKVRLSDKITKKDARRAIAMIHYCLEQVGLDPETGKIDIDRISTGITTSERTKIVKVRDLINQLEQKVGKVIPIDDIITAAKEDGIDEDKVIESIEKLKRSGDLFEPKRGSISKI